MGPVCRYAWADGRFVEASRAAAPVTSHGLHYGTTAFEGVRAYWDGGQLSIFRLADHVRRLRRSCAAYSMRLPWTDAQLRGAAAGLCRRNRIREDCYIRPFVFVADQGISLRVTRRSPTSAAAFAFPMGPYFGGGGISVHVSPWRKFSGDATPMQAKMGGNYLNSVMAVNAAAAAGHDEALLLDARGDVAEATGANLFVVEGGRLATPPDSSALSGITRDTVMWLARRAGIRASVSRIPPRRLAAADEVFLCGTAAEVAPVVRVGRRRVGSGRPGPVASRLAAEYGRLVRGRGPRRAGWLTGVYRP